MIGRGECVSMQIKQPECDADAIAMHMQIRAYTCRSANDSTRRDSEQLCGGERRARANRFDEPIATSPAVATRAARSAADLRIVTAAASQLICLDLLCGEREEAASLTVVSGQQRLVEFEVDGRQSGRGLGLLVQLE